MLSRRSYDYSNYSGYNNYKSYQEINGNNHQDMINKLEDSLVKELTDSVSAISEYVKKETIKMAPVISQMLLSNNKVHFLSRIGSDIKNTTEFFMNSLNFCDKTEDGKGRILTSEDINTFRNDIRDIKNKAELLITGYVSEKLADEVEMMKEEIENSDLELRDELGSEFEELNDPSEIKKTSNEFDIRDTITKNFNSNRSDYPWKNRLSSYQASKILKSLCLEKNSEDNIKLLQKILKKDEKVSRKEFLSTLLKASLGEEKALSILNYLKDTLGLDDNLELSNHICKSDFDKLDTNLFKPLEIRDMYNRVHPLIVLSKEVE